MMNLILLQWSIIYSMCDVCLDVLWLMEREELNRMTRIDPSKLPSIIENILNQIKS